MIWLVLLQSLIVVQMVPENSIPSNTRIIDGKEGTILDVTGKVKRRKPDGLDTDILVFEELFTALLNSGVDISTLESKDKERQINATKSLRFQIENVSKVSLFVREIPRNNAGERRVKVTPLISFGVGGNCKPTLPEIWVVRGNQLVLERKADKWQCTN